MNKSLESTIASLEIDKIIHEPARLKIIIYLYIVEDADFVYLMHKTNLSKGNLSSHLSKLEQAGYVNIKKEFVDRIPRTLMSLSESGKLAFEEYRDIILSLLNAVK